MLGLTHGEIIYIASHLAAGSKSVETFKAIYNELTKPDDPQAEEDMKNAAIAHSMSLK